MNRDDADRLHADRRRVLDAAQRAVVDERERRAVRGRTGFQAMAERIKHVPGVAGNKNSFNTLATQPWDEIPGARLLRGFLLGSGVPEEYLDAWEEQRQGWQRALDRAGGDVVAAQSTTTADEPAPVDVPPELAEPFRSLPVDEPPGLATGRRRMWWSRWVAAGLGVGLALGLVAGLAVGLRLPRPAEPSPDLGGSILGTVECVSGAQVVGVFVKTTRPPSDFAAVRNDVGQPGRAYFSRSLNPPGPYAVHVGCGSRGGEWRANLKSDTVQGSNHQFRCDDRQLLGEFWGTCRSV